jgi:hypothetical protein
MDRTRRTLVIILSMHRSGSSLTTNVLRELGMSLGPFELLGARVGNPYGFFEALPILDLGRRVQARACGFPDERPESPAAMSRFLESRGEWDESVEIPEELVAEGRSLLEALIDSGEVSGFKDPRTVLIWPFWRRVLTAFPEVRVAPIVLLRSPHEMAMSLFKGREGQCGYRTALDVIAVHLHRLRALVQDWPIPVPRVHFGDDRFFDSLAGAVRWCGLSWDPSCAARVFDDSCVHHVPARVVHEAQDLHDALSGEEPRPFDREANRAILEADTLNREALLQRRLGESESYARDLERWIGQINSGRRECEQRHEKTLEELGRSEALLGATREELGRSEALLGATREELGRSEALLGATRAELARSEALLGATRDELGRSEAVLGAARDELREYEARLGVTQRERDVARDELAQIRRELNHAVGLVIDRQARLDRFEKHPVIGPALWGRRRLRKAFQSIRLGSAGSEPLR